MSNVPSDQNGGRDQNVPAGTTLVQQPEKSAARLPQKEANPALIEEKPAASQAASGTSPQQPADTTAKLLLCRLLRYLLNNLLVYLLKCLLRQINLLLGNLLNHRPLECLLNHLLLRPPRCLLCRQINRLVNCLFNPFLGWLIK